ncbi:GalNAc-alpha-(1-_4)-GalNAc-alpha-(1-_3)-diNAcBac-PP-undecaprenol alpha-1,4-N-acetyl-D-galactosaminyltransferase [Rosistilla carotiformis]|uniref:GalNAc-alpha-(1->4)-GalNAc-alpha-(1->3)-diNAcBac-PP-undecaprenol alpha-1,4-N-acetyl-D-galactosaminyltransferase n=1 Tax=Rosistilla carotiformis TaxID=2528017 RepID=A0A518JVV9_9BACT|nr:glycosyltransferase [Rosistilla carotiformis]QDV69671.1 GalNAc-alpha-(1->4)-GalNAc-alpha-(1->3)-diNAcBac-PP-undecaprenol alpha-1,4-N-acetyl-D-galactosaminyltransferase [Rosistilla carotiformis]
MRITCAIHSLTGGGAERVMAGLASRLAVQHSVTLITLDAAALDRYRCDDAVVRIGLDQMSESGSIFEAISSNRRRIAAIRAAVAASRPDVVLSFCDKMNILTLAACKPLAVPVVVSERSQPAHQPIGRFWETLRRWHYPRAAACIVQTAAAGRAVGAWTSAQTTIIPAAIDPPQADRIVDDVDRRDKTLVSVGRLSEEKQIDRLIDAFGRLPESLHDWNLKICGDGPQRAALAKQIETLRLNDRVELCGWCDDVGAVLAGAGAFALTSRYEGFPNALLEAMVSGVPSLSVDCDSGPGEIIDDCETGLIVEQDDPDALTAGLARLLADRDLRQRLSDAGRLVVDRYSWDRFVKAYVDVLRSVTA